MLHKFSWLAFGMMLCGIIVLCGLGTWQVQRLQWKSDMVAQLRIAYDRSSDARFIRPEILEGGERAHLYGRVLGMADFSKAILFGQRVLDKKVGASLIVPVNVSGRTVFVNLGWTDRNLKALQDAMAIPRSVRQVTVTGLFRKPYWNSFTPANIPENDQWFRPDLFEMAIALGVEAPVPYMLYAEAVDGATLKDLPRNERWWPVNNHLHYAIFWYVMALVLAVIYALRFHGGVIHGWIKR